MMKTNYLTAVVLGLLAALSGCQAEDDTPHTPQGNIPVGFSGDVPGTRATTLPTVHSAKAVPPPTSCITSRWNDRRVTAAGHTPL